MSQKQQALITLGLVLETSKAALAFLADPTKSADSSLDGSNLSLLHEDFLSLLSLIYTSTTKLSLVLKPSSPSYNASLEPLKELSDHLASLPHCVRLLQTDHGSTLAAEAKGITLDVLEAIKTLIQTFITLDSEGPTSCGDEYLVRTGAVHDVIEKARGPNGFSRNNLMAVKRIWERNQESLDDGINEVQEIMLNADKSGGDAAEENRFDDGWEELGLLSNVRPSPAELERTKKIYAIVRLSTLLHQRIFKDALSLISPSLPLSAETNRILDDLADASSAFLSSSDNFISTMYPPQVTGHINTELEGYRRQLADLQTKVDPLIPTTLSEERSQNLTNTSKPSDHYTRLHKWYMACINQITKNAQELEHDLKRPDTSLA